jgi:transporter family-2 protein
VFHAIIRPMTNLFVLFMVVAGASVAAQIAINAQLRVVAGSALWATNISFAVSMVIGLTVVAISGAFGRLTMPDAALWRAPWWIWLGGFGGALYVLLAILLTRRLGIAVLSAAGILGQLGAALLIDHYGLFGAPVARLSVARVVGVAMLMIGVVLIRWR